MNRFHRPGTLAWSAVVFLLLVASRSAPAADATSDLPPGLEPLGVAFGSEVQPLLLKFCHKCHSDERIEAEIDLAKFANIGDVHRHLKVWQRVGEMLDSGQMPPKDHRQPSPEERARLKGWVRELLRIEAAVRAGDPGPVVLRRLNNAEYTYTVRDLTGVESLDPVRELPVDGASGEGFTNVGASLSMSPTLLTKYLDVGKEVAAHAVLLPDGIRFSASSTRRDWTNEALESLRTFYGRYTVAGGGSAVNLQGIQFETNQGGRLPLKAYLEALASARLGPGDGARSIAGVAAAAGLSPKYLGLLAASLARPAAPGSSLPLDALRAQWAGAGPKRIDELVSEIERWQSVLWKLNSIGHIGREGGVRSWLEAVDPIVPRQDFKLKIPPAPAGGSVRVELEVTDAGDGPAGDTVLWERPRLVAPGRPDVLLRDLRQISSELARLRGRFASQAAACLDAAAEASATASTEGADPTPLAAKHGVEVDLLRAWLEFLGVGVRGGASLGPPLTQQSKGVSGYDFVTGWVAEDALSVVASSSDQHVRIPGNLKPHSVAVHPSPSRAVVVGWRSPAAGVLAVRGEIQHAHPECGNGVEWAVELRRGNTRQTLASGPSQRATVVPFGPFEKLAVEVGDVVALVVRPGNGDHSCDLTAVELLLGDGKREWKLSRDVSGDLLAGNPHDDSLGNHGVWSFTSEPAAGPQGPVIPAGSLLARWQSAPDPAGRAAIAQELQKLLETGPGDRAKDSPDAVLQRQLTSIEGPFIAAALRAVTGGARGGEVSGDTSHGPDPAIFGRRPDGSPIERDSLGVQAPSKIAIEIPSDLAAGAELVLGASLDETPAGEGSVQVKVRMAQVPEPPAAPPILCRAGSPAHRRIAAALEEFRHLFPPVLCYQRIVPVDEVVTLTLFYREDDRLRELFLDEAEAARLDRLWDELLFVSQEPLELVVAFQQISEFATQDRPDLVKAFLPLRQPILDRAAAFRQRLVEVEPRQIAAVIALAERAYRRPLRADESEGLRSLPVKLRAEGLSHEEALRLTIARVFVSPAFLYRAETPGPGKDQAPVTDLELATRLSYFLWSSLPDAELRREAESGKLHTPEVLLAQTERLLADSRVRRLAIELGCQWLHVRGFDQLDEKSERHYPEFRALRASMYEEVIRYFTDFFQANRTVGSLIASDATFLDESLARFYGIPGVVGPTWRRVEGVRAQARGGILAMAANLAKQSGASRTSPILRGNWLSEVVLGEKLPRPPKNVPPLSDTVPEGLTERQLTERHSSDPACAPCHRKVDPFGFALEGFDGIGRRRDRDAAGLAIETHATLPDGTEIDGLSGLQNYLLTTRRAAFVRQFLRKLLGYALGRSVQLSDEPLLERLEQVLRENEDHILPVVRELVLSRQFREIRGAEARDE